MHLCIAFASPIFLPRIRQKSEDERMDMLHAGNKQPFLQKMLVHFVILQALWLWMQKPFSTIWGQNSPKGKRVEQPRLQPSKSSCLW